MFDMNALGTMEEEKKVDEPLEIIKPSVNHVPKKNDQTTSVHIENK